jgi:hypothetical protein
MASPHPSQELSSVAVVEHENLEPYIAGATYVALCRIAHMRVYAAFKKILHRVRMSPG